MIQSGKVGGGSGKGRGKPLQSPQQQPQQQQQQAQQSIPHQQVFIQQKQHPQQQQQLQQQYQQQVQSSQIQPKAIMSKNIYAIFKCKNSIQQYTQFVNFCFVANMTLQQQQQAGVVLGADRPIMPIVSVGGVGIGVAATSQMNPVPQSSMPTMQQLPIPVLTPTMYRKVPVNIQCLSYPTREVR